MEKSSKAAHDISKMLSDRNLSCPHGIAAICACLKYGVDYLRSEVDDDTMMGVVADLMIHLAPEMGVPLPEGDRDTFFLSLLRKTHEEFISGRVSPDRESFQPPGNN